MGIESQTWREEQQAEEMLTPTAEQLSRQREQFVSLANEAGLNIDDLSNIAVDVKDGRIEHLAGIFGGKRLELHEVRQRTSLQNDGAWTGEYRATIDHISLSEDQTNTLVKKLEPAVKSLVALRRMESSGISQANKEMREQEAEIKLKEAGLL